MSDLALVTGATGFIGYHQVKALLENGTRVRCLVRQTSDISRLPIDQIEIEVGDILQPASLESSIRGVSAVYHLAGNIDGSKRKALYHANVEGTRNIASACAAQSDPPVLVYLSSQEAGGPEVEGRPRQEQDEPAPLTHYGKSKLFAEHAAAAFVDRVQMTFVRASVVFGEYDRETLSVFKAFQIGGVGLYPLPGAHRLRLSMIHAHDLVEFLILTAERGERVDATGKKPAGNGLYYSAYVERPTFAELIEMAARSLNYDRIRIIEVPINVVWIAGWISELLARMRGDSTGVLNLDKARAAAAGSWTCSPEKSLRLGFTPRVSLEDRIHQTANWYLENGWL